ncbi:MAG TPA: glycosyltransferase family 39 protein [Candidatus Woesebacteria bacterium]|nr:glycosyltransferase family 39 protein [Candidatus Woesebacteria bacterium]
MKKNNWLSLGIISGLYFLSRLINLTKLPIFCDEAIYLRWSQIIKAVETLRFIPLSDGKQPLFMWLTVPFLKLFNDPLMAGRFVSVLAGFGTLVGIYLITCLIANQKTALIATLIYLVLPFTFFFDRLALADNLLSMFGVWSLYFSLLITKYPRLDLAMILGITLGLAWLTKSPAIYFIVLAFFTIIQKQAKKFYLPIISVIFALIIYNILRLGPQFHLIALRNRDYVWPVMEILKHPFDPFKPHLVDIFNIYKQYLGLPFFFLFFTQFNPILWAWFILPLLATSIIAKVFTARYILFSLPPLIILLALALGKIKNKLILGGLILTFIPGILFIHRLTIDPFHQKLPPTETGYLSGWTAGWGIKEAADYLKERAKQTNVIVGTEGYFGTLPDGLQIYTNDVEQLTILGVGLDISQIPPSLTDAFQHGDEVYLLFNQSRLKLSPQEKEKVNLVKSYPKPDNDNLELYQIIK